MRKTYSTDLSDHEWKYLEPHLPALKEHGPPRIDGLRKIVDTIFSTVAVRGAYYHARLFAVAHGLLLLQKMALRRCLGQVNRAQGERSRVRLGRTPQPSAGILASESITPTSVGR